MGFCEQWDSGGKLFSCCVSGRAIVKGPVSFVGSSGRRFLRAVLLGACAASPYGAHLCLVRPRFPILAWVGVYTYGCGGKESFWGFGKGFVCHGVIFICLGFIDLEISLGGWREAVSRMAAPRGPTVDHR